MAALRMKHWQLSLLLRLSTRFLWGVCLKGKSGAAFFWAMPRLSPLDVDIGGALWRSWLQAGRNAGEPLTYLARSRGGPVTNHELNASVREVLQSPGVED